eukprot:SAG31_NODE_708_length_12684_cov_8.500199_8_plen_108_part_00
MRRQFQAVGYAPEREARAAASTGATGSAVRLRDLPPIDFNFPLQVDEFAVQQPAMGVAFGAVRRQPRRVPTFNGDGSLVHVEDHVASWISCVVPDYSNLGHQPPYDF